MDETQTPNNESPPNLDVPRVAIRDDVLRPSPTTFADLVDDLAWPRLLRAAQLAIRPDRVALAFLGIVALLVLGSLNTLWGAEAPAISLILAPIGAQAASLGGSILSLDFAGAGDALGATLVAAPRDAIGADPIGVLVLVPLSLIGWSVLSGALSRSATLEVGAGIIQPWPISLAFGVRRFPELAWSIGLPVVFIAVPVAALYLLGLLFDLGPAGWIAGAAWPVFLLLGLTAAVIGWVSILGGAMLVPAIAAEGTDGVDAVQRVVHYVLHKPLRLVFHVTVLVALGILSIGLATIIVEGAISIATAAAGSDRGAGAWLVELWNTALRTLLLAYAVSYVCCASTLLYLVQREVHDGQTHSEVWMPSEERAIAHASLSPEDGAPTTDRTPDAIKEQNTDE